MTRPCGEDLLARIQGMSHQALLMGLKAQLTASSELLLACHVAFEAAVAATIMPY